MSRPKQPMCRDENLYIIEISPIHDINQEAWVIQKEGAIKRVFPYSGQEGTPPQHSRGRDVHADAVSDGPYLTQIATQSLQYGHGAQSLL